MALLRQNTSVYSEAGAESDVFIYYADELVSQREIDRFYQAWVKGKENLLTEDTPRKFKEDFLQLVMQEIHDALKDKESYFGKNATLKVQGLIISDDNKIELTILNAHSDQVKKIVFAVNFSEITRMIDPSEESFIVPSIKPGYVVEADHENLEQKAALLMEKQKSVRENLAGLKEQLREHIRTDYREQVEQGQFQKMHTVLAPNDSEAVLLRDENKKARDEKIDAYVSGKGDPTFDQFYEKLSDVLVRLNEDDIYTLGKNAAERTPTAQAFHDCFELLNQVGIYHAGGRAVNFWSGLEGESRAKSDPTAISDSDIPANNVMFKLWEKVVAREKEQNNPHLTMLLGSAICGVFASNAQGRVNVYVGNKGLTAGNFFYNAELVALRHGMEKGQAITGIAIHTLEKGKWEEHDLNHAAAMRALPIGLRNGFSHTAIRLYQLYRTIKNWKQLAFNPEKSLKTKLKEFNKNKKPEDVLTMETVSDISMGKHEVMIKGGNAQVKKEFMDYLKEKGFECGRSRADSSGESVKLIFNTPSEVRQRAKDAQKQDASPNISRQRSNAVFSDPEVEKAIRLRR